MAVLALKSLEKALADGRLQDNTGKNRTWPVEGGKIRFAHFTIDATVTAVAGDIGTTIKLVDLPAGRIRVLPGESRLSCSAWGAARTLDVGAAAYTASDGKTAVAAGPTDLVAAKDVSGALAAVQIGTGIKLDYFSSRGISIIGTVGGGTIPQNATLEGWIAYETNQ